MVTEGALDGDDADAEEGMTEPTMTLPRWRRFVDAEPADFALLPERQWAALGEDARDAYDERRITYHSAMVVIATPLVRRVARNGRLLTMLNRQETGERRMLILSGPQTTGKTTALKQLGRTHELRAKHAARAGERIPVLYVTTPPRGSPRKLAAEFARFLGLPPIKATHNTTDITDAVCEILIRSKVELVLVDEIHNLNLSTAAGEDMSDHLKYLTEHLPATFAFAGIDVVNGLSGVRGAQILGRSVVLGTEPFPYDAEWQAAVATLESRLRLHRHKPGALQRNARYMHGRTGGMIGTLSHLVRASAQVAILEGQEAITRKLMEAIPVDYIAESGGDWPP
jgi:AAA domain